MFCIYPTVPCCCDECGCRYCCNPWNEELKCIEIVGFSSFPFSRETCPILSGLCWWSVVTLTVFVFLFYPITFSMVGEDYDKVHRAHEKLLLEGNDTETINVNGTNVFLSLDEILVKKIKSNRTALKADIVVEEDMGITPPQLFISMLSGDEVSSNSTTEGEFQAASTIWQVEDGLLLAIVVLLSITLTGKHKTYETIIFIVVKGVFSGLEYVGIFFPRIVGSMVFLVFWPLVNFFRFLDVIISILFRSDEIPCMQIVTYPIWIFIMDVLGSRIGDDIETDPLWEKIMHFYMEGSDTAFALMYYLNKFDSVTISNDVYMTMCIIKIVSVSINIAVSFRKYIVFDCKGCLRESEYRTNGEEAQTGISLDALLSIGESSVCCDCQEFLEGLGTFITGVSAGVFMFVTCLLLLLRSTYTIPYSVTFTSLVTPLVIGIFIYTGIILWFTKHNRRIWFTKVMEETLAEHLAQEYIKTLNWEEEKDEEEEEGCCTSCVAKMTPCIECMSGCMEQMMRCFAFICMVPEPEEMRRIVGSDNYYKKLSKKIRALVQHKIKAEEEKKKKKENKRKAAMKKSSSSSSISPSVDAYTDTGKDAGTNTNSDTSTSAGTGTGAGLDTGKDAGTNTGTTSTNTGTRHKHKRRTQAQAGENTNIGTGTSTNTGTRAGTGAGAEAGADTGIGRVSLPVIAIGGEPLEAPLRSEYAVWGGGTGEGEGLAASTTADNPLSNRSTPYEAGDGGGVE